MTAREPDDRELRDRLRALRVDQGAEDFTLALRRKLVAAGPPAPPSRWAALVESFHDRRVRWAAGAAALGAAAALLLVVVMGGTSLLRPARPSAVLSATQVAVVRLNLSADVPVEAALIRVTLPPELSFWASGESLPQRSFEWTQPLSRGDNEIPIAVRGQRPGRYRIHVDAEVGGARVRDEVVIEVVDG
ncbi:MAG: hypothetical protein QM767_14010 [Anaeromyxobacter sp.]